jgi:hypothetical protein
VLVDCRESHKPASPRAFYLFLHDIALTEAEVEDRAADVDVVDADNICAVSREVEELRTDGNGVDGLGRVAAVEDTLCDGPGVCDEGGAYPAGHFFCVSIFL